MTYTLDYIGAISDRKIPSPVIFHRFDFAANTQRRDLRHFHDDFTTLNASSNPWLLDVSDDKSTIELVAGEPDGIVRLAITGDDNEETWMTLDDKGSLVKFDRGEGDVGAEWRFRTSSIADNVNGIAFGFVEDGVAAGDDKFQADDTGVLSSLDLVAFRTLQADGDKLGVVHGVNGTAPTELIDEAATLVADTWTKAGLWFNSQTGKVSFYVNETLLGTTVVESATNFPDGVALTPFMAAKVGSDAALNLDFDFCRVVQRIV